MSALDAGIGKVIRQLDDVGLREDTIVIVASDNGASIRESLVLETGTNAPFRGGRTETYEGGIRTACIVRWPRRFQPASVCREPLANIDILPMLLNVTGIALPTDRVIDGRNPIPTLAGEGPSPHEFLFFEFRKWSASRRGRWKIVRSQPDRDFELYDLQTDWGETRDLAVDKPHVRDRLVKAFENWRNSLDR